MRGLAACLLAMAAAPLAAQEGILRGTIVDESGAPLPYAVVVLQPGFRQQFADDRGAFQYDALPPGNYRVQVRQVGYRPADTTITAGLAASPTILAVVLQRLPITLAAIPVSADERCTAPGPPDASRDSVLAALFEQLRENALRYRLLADAYPHVTRMLRTFTLDQPDGVSNIVRRDTLDVRSDGRFVYRPGRVVRDIDRNRFVVLPSLPDLADSVFQAVHCFRAQRDSIGDRAMVRLDFTAAEALRNSDVDGSAWLDAATFQLRRLTVRLTRVDRSGMDVSAMSGTVTFRELLPSIIAPDRVTAFASYRPRSRGRGGAVGHVEEQLAVEIRWVRGRPGAPLRP